MTDRVTLFTLVVFIGSIWTLAIYASEMLHQDLERLVSVQQLSMVSYLASEIDHELTGQTKALEFVSANLGNDALHAPEHWQKRLQERSDLESEFNGGVYITDTKGIAIASVPVGTQRIGLNYFDRSNVQTAIQQGKSAMSEVVVGKALHTPVFSIATPIRNGRGEVVGALVGVVNLGLPNFLDVITQNHYGKTGRYLIASKSQRIVVASSDRTRAMGSLPPPHQIPAVDQFVQGFEGSTVFVNSLGVEVLASVQGVKQTDWFIAASIPTQDAFEPMYGMQNRIVIAAICLTLLSAWFTRSMVRRQLAPMLSAAATLSRLSREPNLPQDIAITSKDEIGQLIAGFNNLLAVLRERQISLQDEKERYRVLADQLRLAASVFTYSREAIMVTTPDGTIVDVNDAFVRITGYSREESLGENPRMFASGRQDADFYDAMWSELHRTGQWVGELWNRRKNGEIYIEMQTISAVLDHNGEVQHYVAQFADITSTKEHQQKLEHIAHHDALTGLPNRTLLADRILQGLARARRNGEIVVVVGLDLDGFKAVNDTYGHDAGDRLLIEISQRLVRTLREEDTAARLGGDEFVLLLNGVNSNADCEKTLQRLLKSIGQPFMVDAQHAVQVTGSLGYTLFPEDDSDADTLLRHADLAMYAAKQSGKNRFSRFDLQLNNRQKANLGVTARMEKGLLRQEFVLAVQPKLNMHTGAVVGAEALVRWKHPVRGMLAPSEFLPLVEQNRELALKFDQWVLHEGLRMMDEWLDQGQRLQLSINMSSHQFLERDFTQRLIAALRNYPRVHPEDLEIEIVESVALDDIQHVANIINQCQRLGVRFALDDFGTGYSTLTYLNQLKVDTLKIDQSFVRTLVDSPGSQAVVQGIVGLAGAFGCDLVAEGVETQGQAAVLRRLGCSVAQGYWIARPMPASELVGWIHGFQEIWEQMNG